MSTNPYKDDVGSTAVWDLDSGSKVGAADRPGPNGLLGRAMWTRFWYRHVKYVGAGGRQFLMILTGEVRVTGLSKQALAIRAV